MTYTDGKVLFVTCPWCLEWKNKIRLCRASAASGNLGATKMEVSPCYHEEENGAGKNSISLTLYNFKGIIGEKY